MSRLWYDHPASEWEEALPIGNGRIGAMVYGGTDRERLQVNEESIWLGGPVNRHNPDAKENLPKIRQLLRDGRIPEAEHLMETALSACPEGMHPYQTLGDVQFFFDGIEGGRERKSGKLRDMILCEGTKHYERCLDLETAICRTEFAVGDSIYEREIFASHPADCLVMRFRTRGKGKVNFLAKLRRESWFDGTCKVGENGIRLYGNLGRGGYEFAMELRAVSTGGRILTQGECLKAEGAEEVVLWFTADSTYHYSIPEKDRYAEAYLKAGRELPVGLDEELTGSARTEFLYQMAMQALLAEKMDQRLKAAMLLSYDTLKAEHVADHKSLYDRFVFEVEGAERYENLPTDLRLERLRKGKQEHAEQTEDVGLMKLLYDYGRYLTIAASREGGLPTTLQGLWNCEFFPAWDSKYTININTEMNYWMTGPCNLHELAEPLVRMNRELLENARETAQKYFHCEGVACFHNVDLWRKTSPAAGLANWAFWPFGGAWMCRNLYEEYLFTLDREYLQEIFPVLEEHARFCSNMLQKTDKGLAVVPATSPENCFLDQGEAVPVALYTENTLAIIRNLFRDYLEACEVLKKEGALSGTIREQLPAIVLTQLGSDGRILEWNEEFTEVEVEHRHLSHLYEFHPGRGITRKTPELLEGVQKACLSGATREPAGVLLGRF